MTEAQRVGFIGLGVMGGPMARNLQRAGLALKVYNRSPEAAAELVSEGAEQAESPAGVAASSDIVITMLADDRAVRDVVLGAEGVLAGAGQGLTLVDMSTVSPDLAVEIAERGAERGVAVLDAPVSGGDVGARDGTLSIMVGGDAQDLATVLPVLDVLGATITHVGGHGAGQTVKACNQIVVGAIASALGEALALADAAGVRAELVLDVLQGGLAATRFGDVRRDNLVKGEFAPGFRVVLHQKDLGIALQAGARVGIDLPVTAVAQEHFDALVNRGDGDLDHSAIRSLWPARADGSSAVQVASRVFNNTSEG